MYIYIYIYIYIWFNGQTKSLPNPKDLALAITVTLSTSVISPIKTHLLFCCYPLLPIKMHLLFYCYSLLLHSSLLTTRRCSSHVEHVPFRNSKSCLLFCFDLPHHTRPCSWNKGSPWESSWAAVFTFSLHPSLPQWRWPLPKSPMNSLSA